MSISSDLSRIQTAKSGLASKIPASGLISTYPSQIQDIIDDANATTGETDTTLADAVGTLIDGYGQGGSGGIVITDTVDAAGGTIREITAQGAVIPSASGAFSKIILNGVTQIDLTQDTVAAANLLTGETAHGADGQPVVGAASGGGGGGYFQLLKTITVTENVHAINVVFSDYANRELLIVTDLTLSQSDWMYYVRNGTEPSGGVYDQKTITKNGVAFMRFYNPSSTNLANYIANGNSFNGNLNAVNNFYMYPYVEETMILAGGKIYIYGGRTI